MFRAKASRGSGRFSRQVDQGLGSILWLVIRLIEAEPVLETRRQGVGNRDG